MGDGLAGSYGTGVGIVLMQNTIEIFKDDGAHGCEQCPVSLREFIVNWYGANVKHGINRWHERIAIGAKVIIADAMGGSVGHGPLCFLRRDKRNLVTKPTWPKHLDGVGCVVQRDYHQDQHQASTAKPGNQPSDKRQNLHAQ